MWLLYNLYNCRPPVPAEPLSQHAGRELRGYDPRGGRGLPDPRDPRGMADPRGYAPYTSGIGGLSLGDTGKYLLIVMSVLLVIAAAVGLVIAFVAGMSLTVLTSPILMQ